MAKRGEKICHNGQHWTLTRKFDKRSNSLKMAYFMVLWRWYSVWYVVSWNNRISPDFHTILSKMGVFMFIWLEKFIHKWQNVVKKFVATVNIAPWQEKFTNGQIRWKWPVLWYFGADIQYDIFLVETIVHPRISTRFFQKWTHLCLFYLKSLSTNGKTWWKKLP